MHVEAPKIRCSLHPRCCGAEVAATRPDRLVIGRISLPAISGTSHFLVGRIHSEMSRFSRAPAGPATRRIGLDRSQGTASSANGC